MAKTKEVNHTGYSGDGMEKANEVNNIINKECEENEPNILNTYYGPDKPIGEPLDNIGFGSKQEPRDQQGYRIKIGTKKDVALIKSNPKDVTIKSIVERGNGRDESKALAYEQESATTKEADEIYQANVRRAVDTDHVDRRLEPGLKTSIEVEQENRLKVLFKEVATECNALVRKLAPRKKEPIQKPGGVKVEMELDSSEETKEEKIETERNVEERCGSKRPLDEDLDHACNLWIRKVIKFKGIVKKKENNRPKEGNGTKKFLKGEALSLVWERWNERYQTSDKKSDDLPISYQEIIQNTENAESGECIMSEVGYINEYVDIAEVVDNKLVNQLFDPGGSTFLKTKETAVIE
ncbi:7656_t:CDS:2 [Gigaspora rosea]|nr:7656_t:CDS:2 [Gigaspora rosea]